MSWIEDYMDYTSDQESPDQFHLWAALSVIAAAVSRSVWINRGIYKIYPNIYVVLVADSGRCRKGVPPKVVRELLLEAGEFNIILEKCTPEGMLQRMSLGESRTGHDGKIRIYNSIYVIAPEMVVFMGGQNAPAMIANLVTLYDCHSKWDYTTRTKGIITLENECVNMLAATTNNLISQWLDSSALGGGFAGRTFFVVGHKPRKLVPWPDDTSQDKRERLVKGLENIAALHGEMYVPPEVKHKFNAWYMQLHAEGNNDQQDYRIAGYMERKHDHALKIAALLSISESNELVLKQCHLNEAINCLEQMEPEIPHALSLVGATDSYVLGGWIVELLARHGGMLSRKLLVSKISQHIRSIQHFDEVIGVLIDQGYVSEELVPKKGTFFTLTELGIKDLVKGE